ncbi:sensor histidine kinase [Rugosimonospora acidiphila]|uniref:Oxygen sensor histidine kinase NreB n=1 Tax=Rugosimonospora acidiphila TaxID=556531 RepID=A0ABP9S483_9ACTN
MGVTAATASPDRVFERVWERRVRPVPYALLAILAAFTVAVKISAPGSMIIDLALCALAAAWMLWMYTLHPAWQQRPWLMAVFLAGLLVITAVLVLRDPWFGVFTPACYLYAFSVLPWPWEVVGVAAVAAIAGTAQASGEPKTTLAGVFAYLAVIVVNAIPMCGLAWLGRRHDRHNDQREQALREVSEANRRLEAALAENAGLQQQLMAQAREAGVLDERQRMAREIHDTLAQGLTGIVTQLQAAEQASEDPTGWRRHLAAATALARESLSEARRSVHELRPEPLETARLSEAVSGVAERWSARQGVPVQVATTGTVRPMPPEAEVALLRAAQEALANVAKHAGATRVGVTLSYLEHEVALDVRDDGTGFDPDGRDGLDGVNGLGGDAGAGRRAGGGPGSGFGLVAMRQRIEALSGTVQVESEPGAGTAISARIPDECPAAPDAARVPAGVRG